MPTDASPAVPLGAWLERVAELLPDDATVVVTPAEQDAILDLARVAAHTSERISAPISAYLVGLSLASAGPGERAARLKEIVVRLEQRD